MSKCIAIITARGGSKRIPRKNIKDFCGKPIISYSILAALNANIFDEVMVSTDDIEIQRIAESYGAHVPFLRSDQTSNDYSTSVDVIKEVIGEYKRRGSQFDYICCIYPTAPFIHSDNLKKAYDILKKNNNVDSVFPVAAYSFPPQRGLVIRNDYIEYMYPEFSNTRSQDLEKVYHDCGQFYFTKWMSIEKENVLCAKHSIPLIVNELEQQDIDNESDWEIAELKYRMLFDHKGGK